MEDQARSSDSHAAVSSTSALLDGTDLCKAWIADAYPAAASDMLWRENCRWRLQSPGTESHRWPAKPADFRLVGNPNVLPDH